MYYYNNLEIKQRKLREKYLPHELRFRHLINYVDNENPKAMEQLVIFMCWFNKKLGREKTNQILQLVQKIRMSGCEALHAKKLHAILMYATNLFKKSEICDTLSISAPTLNKWIKETEKLNIKVLNFTQEEYSLMEEFMSSFDKLCRARNLVKGV